MAAPKTTAAAGAPARLALPVMSLATIVATVIAAMWPVLPRATPPTSVQTVRRRSRSSSDAGRWATALDIARGYAARVASEAERQHGRLGRRCPCKLGQAAQGVGQAHLFRVSRPHEEQR